MSSHNLPPHWSWVKLGDVAIKIHYGYTASAKEKSIGPKFLRITDIQNSNVDWNKVPYCEINEKEVEKYLLKENDIVFARTGATVGKSFLIKSKIPNSVFASYLIRLQLSDKALPSFIFLFFQSNDYWSQIKKISAGIGQPNVNAQKLGNLKIPLPPLHEQKKIVEKIEELFSELDNGAASLKKAKEQIKLYRQSVLAAAFSGRLTGKDDIFQKQNSKLKDVIFSGKAAEPQVKYNSQTLPDGWKWVKLGDISSKIQYGFTESASSEKIGPKFLRITDIQNGNVNWMEVPYCKISDDQKHKYLLNEGDIVFARTGATVGKSFLITGKIPESIFASYLIRIKLVADINKKYVYFFFQSLNYWKQITEGQVGIGQPNVNGTKLSKLLIPICPIVLQHQIVSEIEKRFSEADNLEKAIDDSLQKSEALRQSILKKAFEGRLV